jgi:hypothetical protein
MAKKLLIHARSDQRIMKKIHTAASFWRSFGVAIVFWTALGLFQGRVLFVNDRDHANYLPYAHYFVWAGIDAFSWAMNHAVPLPICEEVSISATALAVADAAVCRSRPHSSLLLRLHLGLCRESAAPLR